MLYRLTHDDHGVMFAGTDAEVDYAKSHGWTVEGDDNGMQGKGQEASEEVTDEPQKRRPGRPRKAVT